MRAPRAYGVFVIAMAAAWLIAVGLRAQTGQARTWWEPNRGDPMAATASYDNPHGQVAVLNATGVIDTRDHPFFTALGTNGRACVTCHQPGSAMSLSVDAARDWMLLLGRKTAQEKVAALLLTILQRTSRPCPDCEQGPCRQLIMPLTRTEMADYLGLRLETVSRQLKQLEVIGTIKRLDPRHISVGDVEALAKAAGLDSTP